MSSLKTRATTWASAPFSPVDIAVAKWFFHQQPSPGFRARIIGECRLNASAQIHMDKIEASFLNFGCAITTNVQVRAFGSTTNLAHLNGNNSTASPTSEYPSQIDPALVQLQDMTSQDQCPISL